MPDQQDVHGMTEPQFREFVRDRLTAGDKQFSELHTALAENTEVTKRIDDATAEMVNIFKGAKTGASAFVWFGVNIRRAAKFLYPFVLMAAALGALIHGKWPKWPE